ncbi:hypothetical protein LCGC14_1890120 [marine sediment metagenome]|uniref:Uncharacterized protein n=1 Tax=marine sediment metagenome TaxID=412755 RepID=A0A0F9G001_9ZZZZ
MRINQIFEQADSIFAEHRHILSKVAKECAIFFCESQKLPVFKVLPSTYGDIQKVKVRKQSQKTKFSQTFNEAFESEARDLRQRAIFTNSQIVEYTDGDLFYVFPKNGYKFMYCTEVTHSTNDYQQVFDSLFEQFDDDKAEQMIHDLLKFTYTQENLFEGIQKEVEVIFYNIPYYYAARVNTFEYNDLLTDIERLGDN